MVVRLSRRQKQVLYASTFGLGYKEIAHHLGIATKSVERHAALAMDKLQAKNRTHAIAILFRARIFK